MEYSELLKELVMLEKRFNSFYTKIDSQDKWRIAIVDAILLTLIGILKIRNDDLLSLIKAYFEQVILPLSNPDKK